MSTSNSNFNPGDFTYPDVTNTRKNGSNKLLITSTLPAASATIPITQAAGTLIVPSTATTPTYILPSASSFVASLKNVSVGSLLEIKIINLGSGDATFNLSGGNIVIVSSQAVSIVHLVFTSITSGSSTYNVTVSGTPSA